MEFEEFEEFEETEKFEKFEEFGNLAVKLKGCKSEIFFRYVTFKFVAKLNYILINFILDFTL
jgi:hypothetical protein